MKKSDNQLQHDVMAELEFEPSIDHADIGVSVTDGVVTLTGLVRSYAEKLAAEQAARRVAGARDLAEEIKVRYPDEKRTSDAEIAKRIRDIFTWDTMIPEENILVKVENGWVTLTGTIDWFYQRDAAKKAAGKIHGVVGVTDLTQIRQTPKVGDIRGRITAAFKRSAELDADGLTVMTQGGKVTLTGKVKAWNERRLAEEAAWAAHGVTSVEDKITVSNY
jgi:osmotically-inducible protein OsmY